MRCALVLFSEADSTCSKRQTTSLRHLKGTFPSPAPDFQRPRAFQLVPRTSQGDQKATSSACTEPSLGTRASWDLENGFSCTAGHQDLAPDTAWALLQAVGQVSSSANDPKEPSPDMRINCKQTVRHPSSNMLRVISQALDQQKEQSSM